MILLDAGLLTINATLVAQLLIFLVMVAVLWRLAWGPLTSRLAARQARIKEGLEAAEQAKRDREKAEKEYRARLEEAAREARAMLEQATKMGETLRQELQQKAKEQADQIVAQARGEIDNERQKAVQELRTQVADLAVQVAERVIGENLDARKHQQLIEKTIAEAELHA